MVDDGEVTVAQFAAAKVGCAFSNSPTLSSTIDVLPQDDDDTSPWQ